MIQRGEFTYGNMYMGPHYVCGREIRYKLMYSLCFFFNEGVLWMNSIMSFFHTDQKDPDKVHKLFWNPSLN